MFALSLAILCGQPNKSLVRLKITAALLALAGYKLWTALTIDNMELTKCLMVPIIPILQIPLTPPTLLMAPMVQTVPAAIKIDIFSTTWMTLSKSSSMEQIPLMQQMVPAKIITIIQANILMALTTPLTIQITLEATRTMMITMAQIPLMLQMVPATMTILLNTTLTTQTLPTPQTTASMETDTCRDSPKTTGEESAQSSLKTPRIPIMTRMSTSALLNRRPYSMKSSECLAQKSI